MQHPDGKTLSKAAYASADGVSADGTDSTHRPIRGEDMSNPRTVSDLCGKELFKAAQKRDCGTVIRSRNIFLSVVIHSNIFPHTFKAVDQLRDYLGLNIEAYRHIPVSRILGTADVHFNIGGILKKHPCGE